MAKDEIHERLDQERSGLLNEIDSAFANVDRKDGVSWSETDVLDGYGTEEERAKARALDKDTHWRQLVDDPKWETGLGYGGYSFLDPIGMRYYLPPAMVRCVREGYDVGIEFHLTIRTNNGLPHGWQVQRFGLLTDRQRRCVARFLKYMVTFAHHDRRSSDAESWQEALDSFWAKYLL